MLLPALRSFGASGALAFLFVYGADPARPDGPPLLCGFVPLEHRCFKGLPVPVLTLYKPAYCYLCTPLPSRRSRRGRPACSVRVGPHRPPAGPSAGICRRPRRRPFNQALVDAVHEHAAMTCQWEPTIGPDAPRPSAGAYLATAMSVGIARSCAGCVVVWLTWYAGVARARVRRRSERWIALPPARDERLEGQERSALGSAARRVTTSWRWRRARSRAVAVHARSVPGRQADCVKCSFISGQGSLAFRSPTMNRSPATPRRAARDRQYRGPASQA